jgi:hypothetical protein
MEKKNLGIGLEFLLGQPLSEIPPDPSFKKRSCEKIQWGDAKASLVVRGRGKFTLSKPGGK